MTFNLKTFGYAIAAVFVASAMLASAAHAEEKTPTFTATKTPVKETGSQVETMKSPSTRGRSNAPKRISPTNLATGG